MSNPLILFQKGGERNYSNIFGFDYINNIFSLLQIIIIIIIIIFSLPFSYRLKILSIKFQKHSPGKEKRIRSEYEDDGN